MLNIFKREKRYGVFDSKTYSKLLSLLKTMTTYTMDESERLTLTDYYYDSPTFLLEQNELLLRRRVVGKKAQLKIKRRYFNPSTVYSDNLRSHEREKMIGVHDSLSKHYFFLNNALNSMFSNNLQFDPDKLFEQMKVFMVITMKRETRKLYGYGGLKVEVLHDFLNFENRNTKRKNQTELIQFNLLSSDDTLPLFDDFITRVEKHCKELFYSKDSRFEVAVRMTKSLPSKEEMKKKNDELLRARMQREANDNITGSSK